MNPYCIPGLRREIKQSISINRIESVVCEYIGVDQSLLVTKKRKNSLALTRHLVYWFSRRLVVPCPKLMELSKIYFQDHTTVMNGIRVIDNRIKYEYGFSDVVKKIENKIKSI